MYIETSIFSAEPNSSSCYVSAKHIEGVFFLPSDPIAADCPADHVLYMQERGRPRNGWDVCAIGRSAENVH